METLDLGNNEAISQGIMENKDGTFTVLTFTRSWAYKTRNGAEKKWKQLEANGLV